MVVTWSSGNLYAPSLSSKHQCFPLYFTCYICFDVIAFMYTLKPAKTPRSFLSLHQRQIGCETSSMEKSEKYQKKQIAKCPSPFFKQQTKHIKHPTKHHLQRPTTLSPAILSDLPLRPLEQHVRIMELPLHRRGGHIIRLGHDGSYGQANENAHLREGLPILREIDVSADHAGRVEERT